MPTAPLYRGLFAVFLLALAAGPAAAALGASAAGAGGAPADPSTAPAHKGGGEANLVLPDLNKVKFFNGSVGGKDLLYSGLVVSAQGSARLRSPASASRIRSAMSRRSRVERARRSRRVTTTTSPSRTASSSRASSGRSRRAPDRLSS